MSNIAFDFLTNSFLFEDRYIEDKYRTLSENEINLELNKYKDYIKSNLTQIVVETQNNKEMNVCMEAINALPDEQLLKQLALYLDKVVISDPIFEIALQNKAQQLSIGELMHITENNSIDRNKLAQSVKYMKWSTPLVARQFIKYVPIALLHEVPEKLPILYSKDSFSSELSEELYQFFYDRVKIHNVYMENEQMHYCENKSLQPGTTIAINFGNEQMRQEHIFQYTKIDKSYFDHKTGKFEMRLYIPDTISETDFKAWIAQSINQSAVKEFKSTLDEVIFAKKMDCMFLAKSQFTAELLKRTMCKKNIETDMVNLSMNLELPVVEKISLQDLVSIRYENGEAFHNFRTALNSRLVELRGIDDKDVLAMKLQQVSYELNTVNVQEVNKEYRKIFRSLSSDALLLTGSLVTNYLIGGLTIVGAAGAIAKSSIDYVKYLNEVKENNGYFIWKLNKKI